MEHLRQAGVPVEDSPTIRDIGEKGLTRDCNHAWQRLTAFWGPSKAFVVSEQQHVQHYYEKDVGACAQHPDDESYECRQAVELGGRVGLTATQVREDIDKAQQNFHAQNVQRLFLRHRGSLTYQFTKEKIAQLLEIMKALQTQNPRHAINKEKIPTLEEACQLAYTHQVSNKDDVFFRGLEDVSKLYELGKAGGIPIGVLRKKLGEETVSHFLRTTTERPYALEKAFATLKTLSKLLGKAAIVQAKNSAEVLGRLEQLIEKSQDGFYHLLPLCIEIRDWFQAGNTSL